MFDGLIEDLKYNLSELGTSADELRDYLQFEYDLNADDALAVVKSLEDGLGGLHKLSAEYDDLPEIAGHTVSPLVENLGAAGNAVEDSVFKVTPIVGDINTPSVSDIYYNVNPLVEDFNPPGYEQYTDSDGGDRGYSEQIDGNGNSGAPDSDGSSAGNGGSGFTFAPAITIPIVIEGSADSEALEELRAQLMAEFEAKMRELYDEFREEELQRAALKNQYAF